MKTKFTVLSLLLAGWGLASAQDATPTVEKFDCVADTWIRGNNLSYNSGSGHATLEIHKQDDTNFVGLLGFNVNIPQGQRVKSAKLHFVTERRFGGNMTLYAYGNDFAENTSWEKENGAVEAAMSVAPISTFPLAGAKSVLITAEQAEEYNNLAAWCNDIDVTDCVTSNMTRVNFLLASEESTQKNCIFTKEWKSFSDLSKLESSVGLTEDDNLAPYLLVELEEDSDVISKTILPTADTFVRSSAAGNNYGGNEEMEIKQLLDDSQNPVYFAGLFHFDLPADLQSEDFELESASVRLVTTQQQSKRPMTLYPYENIFDEKKASWNTESEYVLAAFEKDPIAKFEVKGQGNKALNSKDEITGDYLSLSAWTNNIDVTEYLQENMPENGKFIFLVCKDDVEDKAIKFATKESTGKKMEGSYDFAAADLVPQLTITYRKVDNGGGDVDPDDPDDPNVDTDVLTHTATTTFDTQIRKGNKDNKATAEDIEVRNNYEKEGDEEYQNAFYGLMALEIPAKFFSTEEGELVNKIQEVDYRITTTVCNGDRMIEVYDYPNHFEESTIYENEEQHVKAAIANDRILVFETKGSQYSMTDNRIQEQYRNVEAWQNHLDLTEFFNQKVADQVSALSADETASSMRVNLLLKRQANTTGKLTFATNNVSTDRVNESFNADGSPAEPSAAGVKRRAAGDAPVVNGYLTFAAEDLKPLLTITYLSADNGTTHIVTVDSEGNVEDVPVEYYNLQGVRVLNPDRGIYIVRQGNSVKKVVL